MRKWNVGETRSPAGVPWDIVIRDEENNPICSVCRAGWDRISAQKHARLIASAPELLAALEHVKECLRPFIENTEKEIVKGKPMDLSVICQAIAKAKGEIKT